MRFLLPIAITALLFVNATDSPGQNVAGDFTASISGRVTIADKPAAGIRVIASVSNSFDKRIVGKATTDQDGNYRITGLAAGRFTVAPVARAFVRSLRTGDPNHSSRPMNVSAGEEITNIDFKLLRGGVITGRITDADGSPIIGEAVSILPIKTQETESHTTTILSNKAHTTDDRGIYRIYGLFPGTYKVSVGQARPERTSPLYRGGSQYVQTFYPGVSEDSKATLIEIKEGAEVKDTDIRTIKGARGFAVSGRVVDGTSNQPAANVYVGYSVVQDAQQGIGSMSFSPVATDVNGKFTIEGLQPGHYIAFTIGISPDNSSYSEGTKFEVMDGDVSGVEIKLSRGATITGVAVIENSQDPAVAAVLHQVSLYAAGEHKTAGSPSFARSTIKPDGSFKFTGLAPGKVRIVMTGFPAPPKALILSRIEVGGIEQRGGVDVTAGAEINDVRLVFTYGGGTIRGTINISGGTPEGTVFMVMLGIEGSEESSTKRTIEVDSRGHFFAEDLPPGTYQLTVYAQLGNRGVPGFTPVKQMVTITRGNETQVTVNVDLDRKPGSNYSRP